MQSTTNISRFDKLLEYGRLTHIGGDIATRVEKTIQPQIPIPKSRYHRYFKLIYAFRFHQQDGATRRVWVTRKREKVMIDIKEAGRAAAVVALTAGVLFCVIFLVF